MKYKTCEYCGASLDFSEKCDCIAEKEERRKQYESMTKKDKDGQITFILTTKGADK